MQQTIQRIAAGLLLSCVLMVSNAGAVMVDLDVSDSDIKVGEDFTVSVLLTDVFVGVDPSEELLAFAFDVEVGDPAVIGFNGATVAMPFDDDSGFVPDDVAGSVFTGLTAGDIMEPLKLADLSFTALSAGGSTLGILSDLTVFQGLLFVIDGLDISQTIDITVNAADTTPQVPVPATLTVLLIGGLGMWGARRRVRGD